MLFRKIFSHTDEDLTSKTPTQILDEFPVHHIEKYTQMLKAQRHPEDKINILLEIRKTSVEIILGSEENQKQLGDYISLALKNGLKPQAIEVQIEQSLDFVHNKINSAHLNMLKVEYQKPSESIEKKPEIKARK